MIFYPPLMYFFYYHRIATAEYTLERLDSVMGVKPTADLLRFWPGFDIAYGKKYGSVAAAAAAAAAITAAAAGGGERIASSGSSDDPGAAAADGQQQQPPPPTPDAVVAALASALAASPQPLLAPGTPLFTALMSSPQAARAYWYATGFAMGFVEDMVKAGDLSDDYISDEFGQDCG